MRVALVDSLFSWPPNGGADADVFHVAEGLAREGVDARLFYMRLEGAEDRGVVAEDSLPFPAEGVHFELGAWQPDEAARRIRARVDAFAPDAVMVTHGFAMKPHVIAALAHYPMASRYYAHELMCAKDPRRWRDGAPCPNATLQTPVVCRRCGAEGQREPLRAAPMPAWTVDYLAARAWRPEYDTLLRQTLTLPKVLVVYNEALRAELSQWHRDVRVIPGGANTASAASAPGDGAQPAKLSVLMAGRADDPMKGLSVLEEAGRELWARRRDFEIVVTHYDNTLQRPWLRVAGWLSHAETAALYHTADVVVAPSLWQEPFGLVAVEAMAAGKPVIASRTGGLADIVRDGESGLLVPPGDAPALAAALERLLDDIALRRAMGARARQIAAAEYDWGVVVRRHYLPLLEDLVR